MECVAKGGWLALLWMDEAKFEVLSYSKQHIDARIGEIENGKVWGFTGFYRDNDTSKRQESWDMLHLLKSNNSLPWLCAGDFNEILSGEEKIRELYDQPDRWKNSKRHYL